MIACICNNIKQSDVVEALEGLDNPEDLHEALGTSVQCGSCLTHIKEVFDGIAANRVQKIRIVQ